jgi:hypothetical protein
MSELWRLNLWVLQNSKADMPSVVGYFDLASTAGEFEIFEQVNHAELLSTEALFVSVHLWT